MLATLTALKLRLAITNSADDTRLTELLNGVSSRFAKFCDRILEREVSAIEYHDAKKGFTLRHYPVESLTLNYDVERNFAAATQLVANTDYVLAARSGLVEMLFDYAYYPEAIQATVTGGYVPAGTTPTGSQEAIPYDITRATLQQCEFEWKNHTDFGRQSISLQGQSVSVAEYELLPEVKATLQTYRRISL